MSIEISVVICTYNRANILNFALETICKQSLDKSAYEVIVVDNNSTDHTKSLVTNFTRRYSNIRYIFEGKPGLSHARNRGWVEAQGKYIAYTDDDCKLPEEWLSVASEIIQNIAPDILGGPYFPYYLIPKPTWFKDEYRSKVISESAVELKERGYLSGGNIIICKKILELANGFNPKIGMKGNSIAYGEETALILWVRGNLPDAIIYYDPALYVYHLVPQKWMNLKWVLHQRFISGRYNYIVFRDMGNPLNYTHFVGFLGVIGIIGFECTIGLLLRNRKQYPFWQNYIYEHIGKRFVTLGKLFERLYRFFSIRRKNLDA